MPKAYRMHGEQIASIAQTMKELYHVRRIDSDKTGRSESGGATRSLHTVLDKAGVNSQLTGRAMSKKRRPSRGSLQSVSTTDSPVVQEAGSSIQCFLCGDNFPETDFHYTKKSGLCISCWERKIKVA
jgi:hypothetical protein